MTSLLRLSALSAAAGILLASAGAARAHFLFTGNDEKVSFDENTGKTITHPAGKDTVSIIDIADPAKPKIIVNLPLMNTITGPPVNLAITPDRHLALGRQFARVGQGRRWLEGDARQQDLCHRFDCIAADSAWDGRGRQAAFRHGDQQGRHPSAGRQPCR